jgi:hypothetical protein
MKKSTIVWSIILMFSATLAHAHSFWINAFESQGHHSQHAMISLSWGHALPMEDILVSHNALISIDRFELVDPQLKHTELIKPVPKLSEASLTTSDFDLIAADLGTQKAAFKKESAKGVY